MRNDDHAYHCERAEQCRSMAQLAKDPDVRRRHEELAELHASRASIYPVGAAGELSAA
jgi:hypothetical protein